MHISSKANIPLSNARAQEPCSTTKLMAPQNVQLLTCHYCVTSSDFALKPVPDAIDRIGASTTLDSLHYLSLIMMVRKVCCLLLRRHRRWLREFEAHRGSFITTTKHLHVFLLGRSYAERARALAAQGSSNAPSDEVHLGNRERSSVG